MSLAVHLADANYGWAYVIAGWTLTGVVLAAYCSRLALRIRRAQRSLPPEPAACGPAAVGGSTVRPQENLGAACGPAAVGGSTVRPQENLGER